MIRTEDGVRLVPELYSVPAELVPAEYRDPGSQNRIPLGLCPFMWAQSLYIVGKLLQEVSKFCFYDTFNAKMIYIKNNFEIEEI